MLNFSHTKFFGIHKYQIFQLFYEYGLLTQFLSVKTEPLMQNYKVMICTTDCWPNVSNDAAHLLGWSSDSEVILSEYFHDRYQYKQTWKLEWVISRTSIQIEAEIIPNKSDAQVGIFVENHRHGYCWDMICFYLEYFSLMMQFSCYNLNGPGKSQTTISSKSVNQFLAL